MSCEGCEQKNKDYEDEAKDKAQALANKTKEWVGIYREAGETRFAIGAECAGKPIERHYSPEKDMQ